MLFDFHCKGFEAVFHTQYVGKQYFTNNEIDALSLDSYCTTNLNLGYTLRTKAARSVRFGLMVYNLFDSSTAATGTAIPTWTTASVRTSPSTSRRPR